MDQHKTKIEVGARSETGYVRNENQDRMSGTAIPLGQLFIVADGMGGHKGGALAAEHTIQGLQKHIGEAPADAAIEKVIGEAFKKTNKSVYDKAHSGNEATEGMGSTAVLLLLIGNLARVAHVGDSRAYLFRNNSLKQLTTDHTVVQKMVDAGMLKPEEAAHHPNANILERAVGNKPEVECDISDEFTLLDGDAILLCSDGLSGYASDEEIESVLQNPATVQEMPDRLIRLALENKGSEDNVTVQFIQYGARKMPPQPKKRNKANAGYEKKGFGPFKVFISLILVAGISGGLTFFYQEQKWTAKKMTDNSKIEELKNQLQSAIVEKKTIEEEVKSKIKELKDQLQSAIEGKKTVVEEGKKLNNQLQSVKSAKTAADEKYKKELNKARDEAKIEIKDLRQKLQEAKSASERAEKEISELEEKLNSKEKNDVAEKSSTTAADQDSPPTPAESGTSDGPDKDSAASSSED